MEYGANKSLLKQHTRSKKEKKNPTQNQTRGSQYHRYSLSELCRFGLVRTSGGSLKPEIMAQLYKAKLKKKAATQIHYMHKPGSEQSDEV